MYWYEPESVVIYTVFGESAIHASMGDHGIGTPECVSYGHTDSRFVRGTHHQGCLPLWCVCVCVSPHAEYGNISIARKWRVYIYPNVRSWKGLLFTWRSLWHWDLTTRKSTINLIIPRRKRNTSIHVVLLALLARSSEKQRNKGESNVNGQVPVRICSEDFRFFNVNTTTRPTYNFVLEYFKIEKHERPVVQL